MPLRPGTRIGLAGRSALLALLLQGPIPLDLAAASRIRAPDVAPAPAPLPPLDAAPAETASSPPPLDSPPEMDGASPGGREDEQPVRTDRLKLFGLMDRGVVGSDKSTIGHVIDVLVNADGQPQAVLVETGGFMGVGDRKIAVDWRDITFDDHDPGGPIRAAMSVDQVRAAPSWSPNGPVAVAVTPAPPPPPGPPIVAPYPGPLAPPSPDEDQPAVAAPPPALAVPHAGRSR